jgi:nucleoside-diphosphate-sugar epimerase
MLVTGVNGEIGRSLLETLSEEGGHHIVTLDLLPLPDALRMRASASYAGNIMDRSLLDQLAAHHGVDVIFHLAALLSTRSERDPELAHRVNVDGTLNVLRMAQNQSLRIGRNVVVLFPSSIAAYGLPAPAEKRQVGRVREEQWNEPTTMYGCNKLYCEHLGRYFTLFAHQPGTSASAPRVDFRALRLPGLISADTLPTGGTSDFGAEMIHAAARGEAYECFVDREARIPFMAMPDAIRALQALAKADRARLSTCVYNVGSFSLSAGEIETRVLTAFADARIAYAPDPDRARIVASWPEDVDDTRARTDWGWQPRYDWDRAFADYLLPTIRARYGYSE